MGGRGSGRRYQDGKDITNDYHALDVRWLQRNGLLNPWSSRLLTWSRNGQEVASIQAIASEGYVTLDYRIREQGGEWKPMNYRVLLDRTACHLGGKRPWFRCPARGCGRRVAVLYGGSIFACRHCHQLAYASQREAWHDRATRRADRIRDRLGWEAGILNGDGIKPKGMHWRTFERLKTRHDELVELSLAGMMHRLGLL